MGEDAGLGGCLDVETGGEGFGTGGCKNDRADGGGVGESLEDGAEFEPHADAMVI